MAKQFDELFLRAMDAAKKETRQAKEENLRRYGSEKAARKVSPVYRALPSQKKLKLAKVKGQWYQVSKVFTDPDSWKGKYFFFGPGSGFDIHRVVVKSDSLEDALEAAEDKYPHLFFTKMLSGKQYSKLEENPGDDWEGNPENYRYIESNNKWGLPDEDIRVAEAVEEYVPTAVQAEPHSRKAILPDGRTVEYG